MPKEEKLTPRNIHIHTDYDYFTILSLTGINGDKKPHRLVRFDGTVNRFEISNSGRNYTLFNTFFFKTGIVNMSFPTGPLEFADILKIVISQTNFLRKSKFLEIICVVDLADTEKTDILKRLGFRLNDKTFVFSLNPEEPCLATLLNNVAVLYR